jgi:tRNA-dihydrouridine synthase
VGRLKAELGIPVAGNGDIANAADLCRRAASGCCDAVMAGRGAVRRPWIFAAARRMAAGAGADASAGANATETGAFIVNVEETALRFLELLARYQPPEFHQSRARRFFAWYCGNLTWGHHVQTLLNRERELPAMARILAAYFRDHPEDAWRSALQDAGAP